MKRSFFAFVKKEALHIVRDPRTMLIALLIPVVQMILFGFAISTEVNDVEVMASAPKITSQIKSKIARLAHNSYITFKGCVSTRDVESVIARNECGAVVVFGADYDVDGKYQIVLDGSNPVTAQTSAGYLTRILGENNAGLAPGVTVLYNPQLKSAYNFVPGIMGLIFMLICAMLTSVSIVKEKETGSMEVLLVSPVRPLMVVLAKVIPYFVLAAIGLSLILLISKYALGVPLSGSISALLLTSVVYIILALALGIFVSTLVESQMAALLVSGMVMIIPVIMLSGMIFPRENMPDVLRWISNIVPARWYIPAMRKIMIQGLGWREVATEAGVLLTMAVALIIISVKRFKIRLQ